METGRRTLMHIFTKTVKSKFGSLHLGVTENTVVSLTWSPQKLASQNLASQGLATLLPDADFQDKENGLLIEAAGQLEEYLAGKRKSFRLHFGSQGTPFQERVWSELAKIPYGAQISYRALAESLGNPAATRAVGSANGKNPLCIFVPCHRVVRASGSPGGYSGGEAVKIGLLELEAGH